jgi:hypothetical protein
MKLGKVLTPRYEKVGTSQLTRNQPGQALLGALLGFWENQHIAITGARGRYILPD